jgi:hypothetical protein
MTASVFPAAAPADPDRHPSYCECVRCMDELVARLCRRLVEPAPRQDPALTGREAS